MSVQSVLIYLDGEMAGKIEALWKRIPPDCLPPSALITPHISLHVAESYDLSKILDPLARIAADARPFEVRLHGLGMFTGLVPVLYLNVIRDASLSALQKQIWQALEPVASRSSPYTHPQDWVPHVTLAMGGLTPERLICILDDLFHQPLDWRTPVDHLAVTTVQDDGRWAVERRFTLGG
jgi:2'-5' RNA ligase